MESDPIDLRPKFTTWANYLDANAVDLNELIIQKLALQHVCLENVVVKNGECKMSGTIRVENMVFEKQVFIRYTLDSWATYYDKQALYKPGYKLHFTTHFMSLLHFTTFFVSINYTLHDEVD